MAIDYSGMDVSRLFGPIIEGLSDLQKRKEREATRAEETRRFDERMQREKDRIANETAKIQANTLRYQAQREAEQRRWELKTKLDVLDSEHKSKVFVEHLRLTGRPAAPGTTSETKEQRFIPGAPVGDVGLEDVSPAPFRLETPPPPEGSAPPPWAVSGPGGPPLSQMGGEPEEEQALTSMYRPEATETVGLQGARDPRKPALMRFAETAKQMMPVGEVTVGPTQPLVAKARETERQEAVGKERKQKRKEAAETRKVNIQARKELGQNLRAMQAPRTAKLISLVGRFDQPFTQEEHAEIDRVALLEQAKSRDFKKSLARLQATLRREDRPPEAESRGLVKAFRRGDKVAGRLRWQRNGYPAAAFENAWKMFHKRKKLKNQQKKADARLSQAEKDLRRLKNLLTDPNKGVLLGPGKVDYDNLQDDATNPKSIAALQKRLEEIEQNLEETPNPLDTEPPTQAKARPPKEKKGAPSGANTDPLPGEDAGSYLMRLRRLVSDRQERLDLVAKHFPQTQQ